MSNFELERKKKLLEAKMLLDTFEVPRRPVTMSAHQFKKKFGTNQGYSEYKRAVKKQRDEWDILYKNHQKNEKLKVKHLSGISLSDEAFAQALEEAELKGLSVSDILSGWLESGRNNSQD